MSRAIKLAGVFWVLGLCLIARDYYSCTFRAGNWNRDDWILVKSPRWDHMGDWVQKDTYIQNQTPEAASAAEMIGKRASETYTSMVLKNRFVGNVTIRATLSFEDRMAPLIVLAPELGEDDRGRPEYREHFEIVLYDQGINVWHHLWDKDKPTWKKAAYWQFDVAAEEKHRLEVQIRRTAKGKMLVVKLDDREMGCLNDALPEQFYLGVTGCEGRNRFYAFSAASE